MQTPGGPSARTMDVINGATDLENEINALLNKPVFRAPSLDWDWSPEIEWYPGDPIHTQPVEEYRYVDEDGNEVIGYGIPASDDGEGGGQCIRPMIEWYDVEDDFNSDETFMDCDDCEVAGEPQATSCWNCGKSLPGLWRPSAFTVFDPDISYREAPEGVDVERTWFYDIGDDIESFGTEGWREANSTFVEDMNVATWRAFSQDVGLPSLMPWQSRMVEHLHAQQHGNVDAQGRTRMFMVYPRRNAGRAYMDRMIREMFGEEELIVTAKTPIPTPVEIQNSRRRPPHQQNTYPTSINPTQQRRSRNA